MSICGQPTEVHSRVTGYIRAVRHWHAGKRSEWNDRKTYNVNGSQMSAPHSHVTRDKQEPPRVA